MLTFFILGTSVTTWLQNLIEEYLRRLILKFASTPLMSTVGLAPEYPVVSPFIFSAINVNGSLFIAANQVDSALQCSKAKWLAQDMMNF